MHDFESAPAEPRRIPPHLCINEVGKCGVVRDVRVCEDGRRSWQRAWGLGDRNGNQIVRIGILDRAHEDAPERTNLGLKGECRFLVGHDVEDQTFCRSRNRGAELAGRVLSGCMLCSSRPCAVTDEAINRSGVADGARGKKAVGVLGRSKA